MQTSVHIPISKQILSLVSGYVVYFLSIPAIVLHGLGVLILCMMLYIAAVDLNQEITESIFATIVRFFGIENASYHGNPTRIILYAYAGLALLFDVLEWTAKRFFGFTWKWSYSKICFVLTAWSLGIYALVFVVFLLQGEAAFAVPIFFFVITTIATAFAIGVRALLSPKT